MKIFENLVKIEDFSNFSKNWRFLKNLSKLKIFENLLKIKIFENLAKIEDFSNFGKNWRFLKIWSKLKIFLILVKIEDFWKLKNVWIEKKIIEVPMLGFEHPSHTVTHPSTDEAQCCFNFWNVPFGDGKSDSNYL